MTKAEDICRRAAELVSGERARTHGEKLQNHRNIAELWNAYLHICDVDIDLTAVDVAIMQALLKIARTRLGEHNLDNYVDVAGYAACAGEMEENRQQILAGLEDAIAEIGRHIRPRNDVVNIPPMPSN